MDRAAKEKWRQYNANLQENTKTDVLRKCKLLQNLSVDELTEIASYASRASFQKNTIIFEEGSPADLFYIVQDGLVRLYKSTLTGKQLTFTVAGSGDTLNSTALSIGNYFMSSQALNNVIVLKIDRKAYLSLLHRHPSIAVELTAIMGNRLNRECDRALSMVGQSVEQRLCMSLSMLVRKFGTRLSLTREELATCAGTTTETAIRVMGQLKKMGIIGCSAGRSEIMISDPTKLQDLLEQSEGWM
jgi:CRP-like cAMP-binding protein